MARAKQQAPLPWRALAAGLSIGFIICTLMHWGTGRADGGAGTKIKSRGAWEEPRQPRPSIVAFVGVQVRCYRGYSFSSAALAAAAVAAPPVSKQLACRSPPAPSVSSQHSALTPGSSPLPPQTGFTADPRPKYNYEARRAALRASWFPGSRQELARYAGCSRVSMAFCTAAPWPSACQAQLPSAVCQGLAQLTSCSA